MANFTDLPAELKVSVTAQMYPEDCLRFALTSKDHWALCRPLVLKHKALWSKYQTTDGHTVWELVDAIEENYMVANYVQQARIDAERATCWGNIPNGEQLRPRWPATQDVVRWAAAVQRNAILGAPFLSLDHPEKEIQRALATGADGWIVALLLLLLPRLQILWYTQDGEHWWLLNALKYVVWAYQLPNPPPSLPFQHLFRVHIDHYDGARSASWEWVYLFACIPSVQLVYGYISSNDLDGVNQFRTQASVSNVTVLRLASSTIYAEIVDLILSKTTQLKSFTYENGGATVSAAGYNPRKMIASLSRYCGDLLEELILFDEDFTNRVSPAP
ncbi:hypothetical protein BDV95DRAFT_141171 [Massariosphaeria phaeospora]|uniref:F-box domain-containing protein n=1 Tax=Massariosphaeria phaeospora TaxID=100035 RepID=A0A7C8MFJ8_9PLEO|nr:hypothetical protein BDV95DRAFT_141171 [Massariosphaeria phaeospora]